MTLEEGKRKVYKLLDEYSSGGVITQDADIENKMADFFDTAQKDMANYKKIVRETSFRIATKEIYPLPDGCKQVFRVWVGGELTNRYVVRPNGYVNAGDGSRSPGIAFPYNTRRVTNAVTIRVESENTTYPLPDDFAEVRRVWIEERPNDGYELSEEGIRFPIEREEGETPQDPEPVRTAHVEYFAYETVTLEYFASPSTIDANTSPDYVFEVPEDAAQCLPFFVAAQNLMPDLVVDYSVFLQMYYNMRNALDVSLPEGSGTGSVRQTFFGGRR